jgi:tetratricopeptide (TPR) repeat protein
MLANVYLLAGRRDDAHTTALRALDLARRYYEKGPEAWALYLIAESEERSDAAAAERVAQDYLTALRRSEELGMRPLSAHCHLGLGQLNATLGDAQNARTHLECALGLYREMGMQHWPEQAEASLHALG